MIATGIANIARTGKVIIVVAFGTSFSYLDMGLTIQARLHNLLNASLQCLRFLLGSISIQIVILLAIFSFYLLLEE